jgi:L-ascorbate metabolism protein UlaG (beta-lactamase superfamily)
MKHIKGLLVVLLTVLLTPASNSQEYEKDLIPAGNGDIEITFIRHATLMLQYNNMVIHIDPTTIFDTDYSQMPKADLILITHEHGDHLDATAIEQVKTDNTIIILNAEGYKTLGYGDVMANGDSRTVNGIQIDAVPAYNLTATNHPKGVGNGYVLHMGGKKLYIAGDTENIPEMRDLTNIDIAFLPMNRPTMTLEQVVEAARIIHPKILYPYHYTSSEDDPEDVARLLQDEENIEVRIKQM